MSSSDSTENSCVSQFRRFSFDPSDKSEGERPSSNVDSGEFSCLGSRQPTKDKSSTVSSNMTIKTNQELSTSQQDGAENSGISVSLYKNSVPVLAVSETVDSANGTDFGYSQKLFHIADGNLYSVFSPIQGRSYGARPAFLRRQRGAGRQLRGRGRRSHRRGLKFHNFVPSEASLSERSILGGDDSRSHPECMLREEHGTKQITASHWSAAAGSIHNEDSDSSPDVVSDDNKRKEQDEDEKQENGNKPFAHYNLRKQASTTIEMQRTVHASSSSTNAGQCSTSNPPEEVSQSFIDTSPTQSSIQSKSQHGILEMLLSVSKPIRKRNGAWHSMHDKLLNERNATSSCAETVAENNDNQSDDIIIDWEGSSPCASRKHRRKPVQTRRVVPYSEYLTLVEDSEEPLDLSCNSRQGCSNTLLNLPCSGLPLTLHGSQRSYPCSSQGCEACFSNFTPEFPLAPPSVSNIWHPLKQREGRPVLPPKIGFDSSVQLGDNDQAYSSHIRMLSSPQSLQEQQKTAPAYFPAKNESDVSGISHPIAYVYPVGLVPPRQDGFPEFPKGTCLPLQQFSSSPNQEIPNVSSYSQLVNVMPNAPPPYPGAGNGSGIENSSSKGSITEQLSFRYSASNAQSGSSAISEARSHSHNYPTRLQATGSSESSNHDASIMHSDFKVPRAQRRPSQRTLIRQKLEDAFRQNGFLVKTKQVPVGEATFCKFRQLRKYTRYYLKSWHQHLPEEVHKLWKGFLPPKTAVAQASAGKMEDRVMETGAAASSSKGVS